MDNAEWKGTWNNSLRHLLVRTVRRFIPVDNIKKNTKILFSLPLPVRRGPGIIAVGASLICAALPAHVKAPWSEQVDSLMPKVLFKYSLRVSLAQSCYFVVGL